MTKKRLITLVITLGVLAGLAAAGTKAAFLDKGVVSGTSFTVGNVDIKLLSDLSGSVEETNLTDSKLGPLFTNIYPGWVQDYPIKLYNDGSLKLMLTSKSDYETAEDPSSLREYIFVEIFEWDDQNFDGIADPGEVSASSLAKKSILKWKTEGVGLGSLEAGELKGLLLRFSSESIPDTKQEQQATYTFEFDATTDGVAQ